MTVLVAYASRHGSTAEIAETIGEVLASQGVPAEVKSMAEVGTVDQYDAFVVGSAIYMGDWLAQARAFVDEHVDVIARRPTWLFSSGPIGSPPPDALGELRGLTPIVGATHAREHRVFGGRLERKNLGLLERALTHVVRAPDGDYRQLHSVAAWATAIARIVSTEVSV